MNFINKSENKQYKYLTYIVSIYTFFFILPSILLHKIVDFPVIGTIPISILFTGTYFMLLDIITEVYGYYEARRTLIAGLISYSLFIFTMEAVVNIASPNTKVAWGAIGDSSAYNYLFSGVYLVWISVAFCSLFANSINIFLLSKWKFLIKGKYFWMRSVTTSLFAAMIYSLASNMFAFGISMNYSQIPYLSELTIISILAKLFTLLVFAYPATCLCYFLKRKKGVDAYDVIVSYNPFVPQPE